MTSLERLERQLPAILGDIATGSTPDYLDDVFAQTARIRQRPAWTFPERWLPVSTITSRLVAGPPIRWRTIGVIALLIVALAAAAIFVAGSRNQRLPAPFGPADNGPIVYAWQGDIYVRDTLLGEPRLVVSGPERDAIAGFSRDGTKMAFFRRVGSLDDVWVAGVDGSNPTRIAGPFDRIAEQAPWDVFDWSPAGDLIAVSYTSQDEVGANHGVIDLVRTDGGGATRLNVAFDSVDPAWRPGGSGQLLFRGRAPDGWAAFLWRPDGTEPIRLALDHEGLLGGVHDFKNLAWAPGGDEFAYSAVDSVPGIVDDGWYRLHIATIGSNGEILGQRRMSASTTKEHEYRPAWLPSGDGLVFARLPENEQVHLMVGPSDGGRAREAGLVGEEFVVSVSPDGKHVLAFNHSTSEVSDVDLTTGTITPGFLADSSTTLAANMRRIAP
jgi:hypothetical protein